MMKKPSIEKTIVFLVYIFLWICCPATAIHAQHASPSKASRVVIVCDQENSVLHFACRELSQFLPAGNALVIKASEGSPLEQTWQFILRVDPAMKPYSFQVNYETRESGPMVTLAGPDPVCVLHAVYTALEQMGYRFEIIGPVIPSGIDLARLKNGSTLVEPSVLLRGPRLYMNFPMDISSYSLSEAKEYIHNLARMRFNLLSIHSYRGIFIPAPKPDGQEELAGNLFYGQRHDLSDGHWMNEKIHNQKTYCNPDIEPYVDQPRKRSEKTIIWLQELMNEAKAIGFTIQFSFEPLRQDSDVTETVQLARTILEYYPRIDILELVSREGGWGGQNVTANQICELFGPEVLELEPFALKLKADPAATFHSLYGDAGHNILAVKELRRQHVGRDQLQFKVGAYTAEPNDLGMLIRLMDRYAPADVGIGILAGHGSRRVAQFFRQAAMNQSLWKRTAIYTWLEFDGIMFLQQNSLEGILDVQNSAQYEIGLDQPLPYMSFIHWRNAENRLPARFAALTCLSKPLLPRKFYLQLAEDYGIAEPHIFAHAMALLDEADDWATEKLSNIGFCAVGCWNIGGGLGYFGNEGWNPLTLGNAQNYYKYVNDLLHTCAKGTDVPAGRDLLRFLDNRIRCTMIYIQAVRKGIELQSVCRKKTPQELTPEEKQKVVAICDEAMLMFEEYMKLHSELMPDRGCEGTLVSLYYTPIAVLKRIRYEFGGVGQDETPVNTSGIPGPPEPIQFK